MEKGKFKDGKLMNWVKTKGKNTLGNVLDIVGEVTGMEMIENIGESLKNDPDLTPTEKEQAAELIIKELELEAIREKEISNRWESDNKQDLKFPKLIRPSVCAYSWLVVTLICVLEACDLKLPSSGVIIGMCTTVNIAYFGSRGYEKITKIKNKRS